MTKKLPKTPDFESAMGELEQIIAEMESGKLSLENSLASYKRGAELLAQCRSQLDVAQQQVTILDEGVLKPFTAGSEPSNQ
jgi:exodeoxyribonuclease VII small subunit